MAAIGPLWELLGHVKVDTLFAFIFSFVGLSVIMDMLWVRLNCRILLVVVAVLKAHETTISFALAEQGFCAILTLAAENAANKAALGTAGAFEGK